MKSKTVVILVAVIIAALSAKSDGQQARPFAEQLKLAGVMPRGAMVYVQASDLSRLMKTWLASPVRKAYYNSASFSQFEKSHAYLKLQDRKKDFEAALGFSLDEQRLAEIAGGESAVSIYEIGKIEMVFVSETARAKAVTTTLFKQAPQFQERSAEGGTYYVREVATDGGRLNQQFCFAHVDGHLIVATSEGLMIRAIANAKAATEDSLLSEIVAAAEGARGFAAHDVTMWLDQTKLNRSRHFKNYWIHPGAELAGIESGLIDLNLTANGIDEQRWFKVSDKAKRGASMNESEMSALARLAPIDVHLMEVHASNIDELSTQSEQTLFGELTAEAAGPSSDDSPDRTRANNQADDTRRTERYSSLDARFDIDVDDDQAPVRKGGASQPSVATAKTASTASFDKSLAGILTRASAGGYCEMTRSHVDEGKPFVSFERAVVIQTGGGSSFDRAAFERAVIDEMRSRFVIAGVDPKVEWQEDAGVRYVAQSLLERGAAYALSGEFVVLSSSKEFAKDILRVAAVPPPAGAPNLRREVEFYAVIRVTAAKPVFDKLMSKLDGRTDAPAEKKKRGENDQEENREVKFFSENLSSLVAASSIREITVKREPSGSTLLEHVAYAW